MQPERREAQESKRPCQPPAAAGCHSVPAEGRTQLNISAHQRPGGGRLVWKLLLAFVKNFSSASDKLSFVPCDFQKVGAAQWSKHASASQVCRRGARKGQHLLTGFQAPMLMSGTESFESRCRRVGAQGEPPQCSHAVTALHMGALPSQGGTCGMCSDTGSVDPKYSSLPHFLREVGPSVQTTAKIPGDSVPTKGALSNADGGAHVCSTAASCSYCSCCT